MYPVVLIIWHRFKDRPTFTPTLQRIFSAFRHLNIQTGASLFSRKINLPKHKQVILIMLINIFILKVCLLADGFCFSTPPTNQHIFSSDYIKMHTILKVKERLPWRYQTHIFIYDVYGNKRLRKQGRVRFNRLSKKNTRSLALCLRAGITVHFLNPNVSTV